MELELISNIHKKNIGGVVRKQATENNLLFKDISNISGLSPSTISKVIPAREGKTKANPDYRTSSDNYMRISTAVKYLSDIAQEKKSNYQKLLSNSRSHYLAEFKKEPALAKNLPVEKIDFRQMNQNIGAILKSGGVKTLRQLLDMHNDDIISIFKSRKKEAALVIEFLMDQRHKYLNPVGVDTLVAANMNASPAPAPLPISPMNPKKPNGKDVSSDILYRDMLILACDYKKSQEKEFESFFSSMHQLFRRAGIKLAC